MQSRWGISYKDAAHRLYLLEVEKFREAKQAEHAITSIRDRIHNTVIHDITPIIYHIDHLEWPDRGNIPKPSADK
jgi:hypothetical protein